MCVFSRARHIRLEQVVFFEKIYKVICVLFVSQKKKICVFLLLFNVIFLKHSQLERYIIVYNVICELLSCVICVFPRVRHIVVLYLVFEIF